MTQKNNVSQNMNITEYEHQNQENQEVVEFNLSAPTRQMNQMMSKGPQKTKILNYNTHSSNESIGQTQIDITFIQNQQREVEKLEQTQAQLFYKVHQDGEVESVDKFKVRHLNKLTKGEIQETIMKDCFGHLDRNKFQVVSLKIKTNDGIYIHFDDDLDISELSNFDLIIRVSPNKEEESLQTQENEKQNYEIQQLKEKLNILEEKIKKTYQQLHITDAKTNTNQTLTKLIGKQIKELQNKCKSTEETAQKTQEQAQRERQENRKNLEDVIKSNKEILEKVKENGGLNYTIIREQKVEINEVVKQMKEQKEENEKLNDRLSQLQNNFEQQLEQNQKMEKQLKEMKIQNDGESSFGISKLSSANKLGPQSFAPNMHNGQLSFNEEFQPQLQITEQATATLQQKPINIKSKLPSQKITISSQLESRIPIMKKSFSLHKVASQDSKYDMAFLYADPIIKEDKRNPGNMTETYMPLDLDKEYKDIKENISRINKQFSIKKIAVNSRSLQETLTDNPKIIHVSCHGDVDKNHSYYLAFEQEFTGLEHQFTERFLKQMMESVTGHQIKLAFVNACHSGKMGDIFFKAGVPVVVCVQSNEQIDDECCKEFSKQFYKLLVEGKTIKKSFQLAQDLIQVLDTKYRPCCCAHPHTEDCWWFYLHSQDQKEAHEIHTGNCCDIKSNVHDQICKNYKKFSQRRKQIKQEMKKLKNSQQKVKEKPKLTGGFGGFFDQISDTDDLNDYLGESNDDDDLQGGVLCCCKPQLIHNESMKYQLLYSEEIDINRQIFKIQNDDIFTISSSEAEKIEKFIIMQNYVRKEVPEEINKNDLIKALQEFNIVWENFDHLAFVNGFQRINYIQFLIAAQKGYSILDSQIFVDQPDGYIQEKHLFKDQPSIIFTKDQAENQLIGRHKEIHDILKFLSGQHGCEKVYFIHDNEHKSSQYISKYCVWYLQNRNKFTAGSYYVNMKNEKDSEKIYEDVCKQMNFAGGMSNLISSVKNQQICVIIANCDGIIEHDLENFQENLMNFTSQIDHLKIIILTHRREMIEIEPIFKTMVRQCQFKKLESNYQANIMHQILNKSQNQKTRKLTLSEIKNHALLKDYSFTVDQIVNMCNDDLSLDELYQQKKNKEDIQGFSSVVEVAKFRLEKMQKKEGYQDIKQLVHILAFLPNGLTLYDFEKIKNVQADVEMIELKTVLDFFEEFGLMEKDNLEMQILKLKYDESGQVDKMCLEPQLRKYLFDYIIRPQKDLDYNQKIQEIVLIYWSNQARELVLKDGLANNFDLYILSCTIDSGNWASPKKNEKNQEEYELIQDLTCYFRNQYQNILFCLDLFEVGFLQLNEDDFLDSQFSEIILCVPSIMIENEDYTHALEIIERGIKICNQNSLDDPHVKLLLMRTSIQIVQQQDQNLIAKELQNIEARFSKFSIMGEVFYLRAVNGIILMDIEEDRKEMKSQGQRERDTSPEPEPNLVHKNIDLIYSRCKTRSKKLDNTRINSITKVNQEQDQFDKLFCDVISNLNQSINEFKQDQDKIGIARATFLKSEFVINYDSQLYDKEKMQTLNIQYQELCDALKKIEVDLYNNQNYQTIAESNLIQAKINLQLKQYQEARDASRLALKYFRDFKLEDLRQIATPIFGQCSKKLQQKQKNLFLIADSMPITDLAGTHKSFQNISKKFHNEVVQRFKNSGKQIDYKIEVLNDKFLKNLESCQILHLRPKIYDQDFSQKNKFISIENQFFNQIEADEDFLKNQLIDTQKSLQISLVILEMPNCESLAKWFKKQLKVNEVIYFKVDHIDQNKDENNSEELLQIINDKVEQYMRQFLIEFYSKVIDKGQQISINYIVEDLNNKMKEKMDVQQNCFHVKAKIVSDGNFLFGKMSKDEQLEDGPVFDLSRTSIEYVDNELELSQMPFFEKSNFDMFKIVMNYLTEDKKQIVNFHSKNGIMSKKLVNEVSNYLKQRNYFPKGIYWLGGDYKKNFIANFEDMCSKLNQFKSNNKKNCQEFKHKNHKIKKYKSQGLYQPPRNNCLIIIDQKCGDFEHDFTFNNAALQNNINEIKKKVEDYVIVLISNNEITFQTEGISRPINLKHHQIGKLSNLDMKIYFTCLINSVSFSKNKFYNDIFSKANNHYLETEIISKINGNITVLELLCFIVSLDFNVIQRIKIEEKQKFDNLIEFDVTQETGIKRIEALISKTVYASKPTMNTLKQAQNIAHFEMKYLCKDVETKLQQVGKIKSSIPFNLSSVNKMSPVMENYRTISKENSDSDSNIQVRSENSEESEYSQLSQSSEKESVSDPEVENLIQTKNSEHGCFRYHDIYVRAISQKEDDQLYIHIKNDEKNQFSPKLKLYRKVKKELFGKVNCNYTSVQYDEVKQIIIYVPSASEEDKIASKTTDSAVTFREQKIPQVAKLSSETSKSVKLNSPQNQVRERSVERTSGSQKDI